MAATTIKRGELAAQVHRRMCDDPRFGYSWDERWGAASESWTVGGVAFPIKVGDYDCSSSTITAWRKALAGTKWEGRLDAATYTGNMRAVFVASGLFEWKPMSFTASPGDLYLNEECHVAMCQTQVPDVLSEFCINEAGGVYGGKRGDQTGGESRLAGYYDYPWSGILHYNGKADTGTPSADTKPPVSGNAGAMSGKKAQPRYAAMANWEWLAEMRGKASTDAGDADTYAGIMGIAIQYLACDAKRYRVKTQASGWLPWVSRYDLNDLEDGCAGDGSAIVAVEVDDSTVKFRVHARGGSWFDWMRGRKDTGGSPDTFAGDGTTPIDAIQMVRA